MGNEKDKLAELKKKASQANEHLKKGAAMPEKTLIHIVKNKGTPIEEAVDINCDSFFIVHVDKGKMDFTGHLDLMLMAQSIKPLIPVAMKYVADKLSQSKKR